MKKYIICLFSIVALTTSCNNWLDVSSSDQIAEKELYSDYSGYYNVLNGLYQSMAASSLYGKEMTWGFASALSQYYLQTNTSDPYYMTTRYDFASSEVIGYAASIWENGYNVIANANNLIEHTRNVKASKFIKGEEERSSILGEGLAIRAAMHFDLLRLFAPAPATAPSGKYIPYHEKFPAHLAQSLTVDEVVKKIESDLDEAATLLYADTLTSRSYLFNANTMQHFQMVSSNFWSARCTHLSYPAVKALQARVYLYNGEFDKAYEVASDLITKYGTAFTFTSQADLNAEDGHVFNKMYNDILFGLYKTTLANDYKLSTKNTNSASGDLGRELPVKNVVYMYGITSESQTESSFAGSDNDDYRYLYLLKKSSSGNGNYISSKYEVNSSNTYEILQGKLIPMIRMSEIYLIAAEAALKKATPDADRALELVKKVKVGRGAASRVALLTNDATTLMKEITLEYWKEQVGEGQMFYFYKRLNQPVIDGTGTITPSSYVLTKPDSESVL